MNSGITSALPFTSYITATAKASLFETVGSGPMPGEPEKGFADPPFTTATPLNIATQSYWVESDQAVGDTTAFGFACERARASVRCARETHAVGGMQSDGQEPSKV